MSRIRGKDTKPELVVRSMLHRMGYRFRLHRRDLPGRPDIVFVRLKRVVFVHGCFWHMHRCKYGRVTPAINAKFWAAKRRGNVERDRRNARKLRRKGWKVLSTWECEIRDLSRLERRCALFLSA
jgi:DNA mismatch endonuclease (patch repair protein)